MTVLAWTDERVDELKKLWESGYSASQIAAALGGITRNSAIGKIHRLGLSGRVKGLSSTSKSPRKVCPAQHMTRVARIKEAAAEAADEVVAAFEGTTDEFDSAIPESQRLTLLDLTDATCHWPIGDPQKPEFSFCGGRAIEGLPYCVVHTRAATQPASDGRRRRPTI